LGGAVAALRAALAAVQTAAERGARRNTLRRRRRIQAEALAELIEEVEALTAQGPEDLQSVLGDFGPDWVPEHRNYVRAAHALATEFRALRCRNPDPRRDVHAVQVELRNMLKHRKCRNKDAIRILPIAVVLAFRKSGYEQRVEHAFGTALQRDHTMVSEDDALGRTWGEFFLGRKRGMLSFLK